MKKKGGKKKKKILDGGLRRSKYGKIPFSSRQSVVPQPNNPLACVSTKHTPLLTSIKPPGHSSCQPASISHSLSHSTKWRAAIRNAEKMKMPPPPPRTKTPGHRSLRSLSSKRLPSPPARRMKTPFSICNSLLLDQYLHFFP